MRSSAQTGDDPLTAYKAVAKELADVLYVTYGAADALRIDLPAVFVEVHRSNMSSLTWTAESSAEPTARYSKAPATNHRSSMTSPSGRRPVPKRLARRPTKVCGGAVGRRLRFVAGHPRSSPHPLQGANRGEPRRN
ncbi:nucleoside triphosphate pyrophosphohydrolase family protein [Nonomuraea sp. SYSU D8015]|uniref:nucleoside triphosphate pyrophosphohydrolase family protein n=1 Tax=Nonomuraea sp. SYSU D8015 TaxID=2593644 RepID=UPI003FA5EA7A